MDIETQRRAKDLDRVDIQISGPSREWVIWLELKQAAEPDAEQLQKYEDVMPGIVGEAESCGVVLIAPGHSLVAHKDALSDHPSVAWEDIHRALRKKRADGSFKPESIDAWLSDQFTTYLEENGMSELEALRSVDLAVLGRIEGVQRRFRNLVSGIDPIIETELGPDFAEDKIHCTYPKKEEELNVKHWRYVVDSDLMPDAGDKECWLEWHVRPAPEKVPFADEWAVGAGVKAHVWPSAVKVSNPGAWTRESWTVWPEDDWMFVMRHRPLSDWAYLESIDEQATQIGCFVAETLRAASEIKIEPGSG